MQVEVAVQLIYQMLLKYKKLKQKFVVLCFLFNFHDRFHELGKHLMLTIQINGYNYYNSNISGTVVYILNGKTDFCVASTSWYLIDMPGVHN